MDLLLQLIIAIALSGQQTTVPATAPVQVQVEQPSQQNVPQETKQIIEQPVTQKEVTKPVVPTTEKKYTAKTIDIELKRAEIQVLTYKGLIERYPDDPKVDEYKAELSKYEDQVTFWKAKKAEIESEQK